MQPPGAKSVIHDDGPEEGEIVSDDLEDISDDSIVFTPLNGKSLSRRDHLQALSLSSITDQDEISIRETQKRRKCPNRRHIKRRKRSKRRSIESESSDDNLDLNSRLKNQLKAAVRVDIEEASKNSLLTRLKPMIKNLATDSDHSSSNLKTENGVCSKKSEIVMDIFSSEPDSPLNTVNEPDKQHEDEHDSELRELRLEALKTALANKFGKLKNKKIEENKENTANNCDDNQLGEPVKENIQAEATLSPMRVNEIPNIVPPSPDEDEDVLRALLLASMSKKITKTDPESLQAKSLKVQNHLNNRTNNNVLSNVRTNSVTNFKVTNVQNPVVTKLVNVPVVKPLIIHVDSDSDSDIDLNSSPEKPQVNSNGSVSKDTDSGIESTVEKFLKEQRAKVELQTKVGDIKPKPLEIKRVMPKQVINNDKKFLKPIQFPKSIHNTPITSLNKSTLECLPEDKQQEYKTLVLMIKKAEQKKPRLRKISQRTIEAGKGAVINKNNLSASKNSCVVNKISVVPTLATMQSKQNKVKCLTSKPPGIVNTQSTANKNHLLKPPPKFDDRSNTNLLQNTLKDVHFRKDGRLQIQEKYKLIRPLVRKINELTKEQKRCNQEVKKLLEQLAEAKKMQQEAQKNLSSCVKDFVNKKLRIDRSFVHKPSIPRTSTPVKTSVVNNVPSLQNSNKSGNSVTIVNQATPVQKTTNKNKVNPDNNCDISTKTLPKKIESPDVLSVNLTEIVDPNDVDCIMKQTEEQIAKLKNGEVVANKKSDKTRYVSPLDTEHKKQTLDPYVEMCPYEVYGMCKDTECKYNHLPK